MSIEAFEQREEALKLRAKLESSGTGKACQCWLTRWRIPENGWRRSSSWLRSKFWSRHSGTERRHESGMPEKIGTAVGTAVGFAPRDAEFCSKRLSWRDRRAVSLAAYRLICGYCGLPGAAAHRTAVQDALGIHGTAHIHAGAEHTTPRPASLTRRSMTAFVQLHVGDAVHQKASRAVGAFKHRDGVAPDVQVLGHRKTGRAAR